MMTAGRHDIHAHTHNNRIIEIWRKPREFFHGGRFPGARTSPATIEAYTSDGGSTYVVFDGRPTLDITERRDDRYHTTTDITEARRVFAALRRDLAAAGYKRTNG